MGAALSLTLNALQNEFAGFIVVLFCVSAWIGIQHLGYTEFAAARQLIVKGTFRRIIDYHTRLSEFERKLQDPPRSTNAGAAFWPAAKTSVFTASA